MAGGHQTITIDDLWYIQLMPVRLNPEVSALIKQQFGDDGGKNLVAQIFEEGAVIHRQDNLLFVHVGLFAIDLEVQQPDGRWQEVEPKPWSPRPDLSDDGATAESLLADGERLIFPGNFGRGMKGKHNQRIWRENNFTPEDAPIHRGYAVTGGHRGGLRQATSPPVMRKFFDQSYKLRRYR